MQPKPHIANHHIIGKHRIHAAAGRALCNLKGYYCIEVRLAHLKPHKRYKLI